MTHYELNARINELNAQAANLLAKIKARLGNQPGVTNKRVSGTAAAQMIELAQEIHNSG